MVTKEKLVLIAIMSILLIFVVEGARAEQPPTSVRDIKAEEACVDSLNSSLYRAKTGMYVLESEMVGEIKPYVWVINYKIDSGLEMQGYCAINIPRKLVVPAFRSISEAINFVE